MKLLVEGHPYPFESIRELFPNIDELDVVGGVASVNYVGYYYYAEKSQAVFILPKVVIDHRDNLFGVEDCIPSMSLTLMNPEIRSHKGIGSSSMDYRYGSTEQ